LAGGALVLASVLVIAAGPYASAQSQAQRFVNSFHLNR